MTNYLKQKMPKFLILGEILLQRKKELYILVNLIICDIMEMTLKNFLKKMVLRLKK